MGNREAGDPSPIQARRREYLRKEYAKYNDEQLIRKQNEIVSASLARGRRVLAMMPADEMDTFVKRYFAEKFAVETLAQWRQPAKLEQPPQDRPRGHVGPGPGGPPAPGGGGIGAAFGERRRAEQARQAMMNNLALPTTMRLIEIKRK
jgi:hypothetical protein